MNFYDNTQKKRRKKHTLGKHFLNLPIITLAGTAFHSNQKVINDDVTNIMPGMKTVVK